MRAILLGLGVILITVVAVVLTNGEGAESPAESSSFATGKPTEPAAIADACAGGCVATPAPDPTPCPYCDQDFDRWRELGSVAPPELLGTSAVLMESGCGEVIYGRQAGERRQPASLAKIATAMVVVDDADLADVVDITITGWDLVVENDSSIMGLEAGMRLSVEELLYGLLLPSGNDAALQLSEVLGGEDRVVERMNERVQALGLTDTHFMNSHGLDEPGAYTTPFDMAVLGWALLDDPLLREIVSTEFRPEPWHDLGGLWNGNYLLYIYEDAIGVKTGYTEEAGWSIVSAAERDGRLLIASVFNSADVYWDSMRLFDWAFESLESAC